MPESALHRQAKQILLDAKRILVPDLFAYRRKDGKLVLSPKFQQTSISHSYSQDNLHYNVFSKKYVQAENVIPETRIKGIFQPDLIFVSKDITFGIEIKVSNSVSPIKRKKIQDLDFPLLEIDLTGHKKSQLHEEILYQTLVENLDRKKWIHISNLDSRYDTTYTKVQKSNRKFALGSNHHTLWMQSLLSDEKNKLTPPELLEWQDLEKRPIVIGHEDITQRLVEDCPLSLENKLGNDVLLSECMRCKFNVPKGDKVTYIVCSNVLSKTVFKNVM